MTKRCHSVLIFCVAIFLIVIQPKISARGSGSSFGDGTLVQRMSFANVQENSMPINIYRKQYRQAAPILLSYDDSVDSLLNGNTLMLPQQHFPRFSSTMTSSFWEFEKQENAIPDPFIRNTSGRGTLQFYYLIIAGLVFFLIPFQLYGDSSKISDMTKQSRRYTFLSLVSFPILLGGLYFLYSSSVPFINFFCIGCVLFFIGYMIPYVSCKLLFNGLLFPHYVRTTFLSHMGVFLGVTICLVLYMGGIELPLLTYLILFLLTTLVRYIFFYRAVILLWTDSSRVAVHVLLYIFLFYIVFELAPCILLSSIIIK